MNLCAIDKRTLKFITPSFAERYDANGVKNQFRCVDANCNGDLKFRVCPTKKNHFAHIHKCVCTKYTRKSGGDVAIHLEAQRQLKSILENGFNVSIQHTCPYNNKCSKIITIPPMTDTTTIELEYHFNYNGCPKYADVAYLDNGEIKYIFEILNTSETHEDNRPEPWCEIIASSLLNIIEDAKKSKNILFHCVRRYNCNKCKYIKSKKEIEKEFKQCFEKKIIQCRYQAKKKLEDEKMKLKQCKLCFCNNCEDTWQNHFFDDCKDCMVVRKTYCYKCGDNKFGCKKET